MEWNVELIAHQPVTFNSFFAGIQLAIGVGLLVQRTRRLAIVTSVFWAVGVWYLGEGLGGLAGGHTTALAGAPGAAAIYLVLAVAAWPTRRAPPNGSANRRADPIPHWLLPVWAGFWVGAAVLDLLPDNRPASSLAVELQANATSVPAWLADFDRWLGRGTHLLGGGATALLVGLGLAIGLASLGNGTLRSLAIWSGIMLAGLFWAAGQSFGQFFSGQATDPGTGPLVMLLGLAALSARSPGPRRRGPGQARTPSYGCRQAHDGPSLGAREATPAGDESQVNRPVATTLPDPSTTLTARTVVAATGSTATQEPYPSARENRPTT